MKRLYAFFSLLVFASCGYPKAQLTHDNSVGCYFFPNTCTAPPGRDCDQPTIQTASIVNRTGRDLDLEVTFIDASQAGVRMLARVQILEGGRADIPLGRAYFAKRHGHADTRGNRPVDAVCSAEAEQKFVKIGLTDKSFREATNCRNSYQQINTFEPYGAACDPYSRAQDRPE